MCPLRLRDVLIVVRHEHLCNWPYTDVPTYAPCNPTWHSHHTAHVTGDKCLSLSHVSRWKTWSRDLTHGGIFNYLHHFHCSPQLHNAFHNVQGMSVTNAHAQNANESAKRHILKISLVYILYILTFILAKHVTSKNGIYYKHKIPLTLKFWIQNSSTEAR